jgi:transcriptional regulator with XRE-family HTH domain
MVTPQNQKVKPEPPLARRVKAEMALRGLTQKDLAREVCASRVSVNRALKHGLNKGVLSRILRLLDIPQTANTHTK